MSVSTISGINRLPPTEKQAIYELLIPPELVQRCQIPPDYVDHLGNSLLKLDCPPGSTATEMKLFHRADFPDPVLYGHITDTFNGMVHVLLYVLNDPSSPRFDVDRLPDGQATKFGTFARNIPAEIAAMDYGLAPGQIRRGLRLLSPAITAFERFVASLGHDLYFAEPLYYHNALIFEHYGFAYQKGRRLMERIHQGFLSGGDLFNQLDNSNPFRRPEAASSVRLRSWAIHDGILGEPFNNVTMYKWINKSARLNTCVDCPW